LKRLSDARVDFPLMEYHLRRLIFDLIALQQCADGREEPTVIRSGQAVAVRRLCEGGSLTEIISGGHSYLVSAMSLQARSVDISG
jgi:hypothetical protein